MLIDFFKYYYNSKYSKIKVLFPIILSLGLLQFIGIGLFIPLVSKRSPSIDSIINEYLLLFKQLDVELNLIIFIIIVFFFKTIVVLLFNKKLAHNINHFVFKTRSDITKLFLEQNYKNSSKYEFSFISNLINKETEKLSEGYVFLMEFIVKVTFVLIYFALALLNSLESCIIAVVFGFLYFIFFKKITILAKKYSVEIVAINEQVNTFCSEIILSLKYLKGTSNYKDLIRKYNRELQNYSYTKYRLDFFGKISKELPESSGIILISFVMFISLYYFNDSITNSLISCLLLYKAFTSLTNINAIFQKIVRDSASIHKIKDYFTNSVDHIDKKEGYTFDKIYKVEFLNANFSFNNGIGLKNINLSLKQGYNYAIVGPSGSGKSTLLNLLTSLYSPIDGVIKINDKCYSLLNKYELRKSFGFITQEQNYFSGSIKDNITMFNDNYSINEIMKIVKICELEDLVDQKGLNTPLLSLGREISGGQLQRINIARELIRNPSLLIFDEGTSALDSNTEDLVMNKLFNSNHEMIIVFIAHRLSLLHNVNTIFYLEEGEIIGQGNLSNLYNNVTNFKLLCNKQNIYL